jgi:hypothetical protein
VDERRVVSAEIEEAFAANITGERDPSMSP